MFDFQRLRRSTDLDSAPLIAASIFLDALNVFLFFLRIFSGQPGLGPAWVGVAPIGRHGRQ
jgi:hypothetical protein